MAFPNSEFRLQARLTTPIALDAELSCGGGQLLALVGPSGSGKSTLLRMIAGLTRPDQGRIECAARCWFDSELRTWLSPQQRRVGFVPQHYGLFPHMSALANVMAGLHELVPSEREARARRWLEKVHLRGLEERRPAELSGGQQQRVALARALVREPSILLLDEPFSAVDRATRETLYIELAELKRELELPIVMVTHDLNEALLLADRMTLLADGRTLQSGVPRELVAQPVNETAARLVGVRNLFDGEVLRHDETLGFTWIKAGDLELACPIDAARRPGDRVRWMVPTNGVRLRSLTNGDLPPSPNRLRITVQGLLPLGDEARVTASLPGIADSLHVQLSVRLANQLGLRPGATTEAVLRERQLHILPAGNFGR